MKKFIIKSEYDGVDIPSVYYESKRNCIDQKNYVFFHGLSTDKYEYLDFYKTIGERLSALGHNVLCFDARAHGDSNRSSTELTVSNLISDGVEVIKWLLNNNSIEKVRLFGTSFGAIPAISISYILPKVISKTLLLAPAIDLNKLYINPTNKERAERYNDIVDKCIFRGEFFNINDRVFFTRDIVLDFKLINLISAIQNSNIKYDIMHGTCDTMIPYELSKAISENSKNITLHTFENMDHGFMEIGDDDGISKKSLENIERIISILTA